MRSGKYYQAVKIGGVKHDLHRLIAEQTIGRPLTSNEVVHHIDGNKQNNDPANLVVLTRAEHSKLHATGQTKPPQTCAKLAKANTRPRPDLRCMTPQEAREAARQHDNGSSWRAVSRAIGRDHTTVVNNVRRYQREGAI